MQITKTIIFVLTSITLITFDGISKKHSTVHHEAHTRLQAKNVTPIERQTVRSIIDYDVLKREKFLSSESQQMVNDLLAEANKYIGRPYKHGSKGPNAFDCSGFTSFVYKQFGYNISAASRQQSNEGVAVDRKNLRKGDLVFFSSRSSGKNVGHVGIVVSADSESGDFKFIHASIKGVKVSDFAGYYVQRYICARRIITE